MDDICYESSPVVSPLFVTPSQYLHTQAKNPVIHQIKKILKGQISSGDSTQPVISADCGGAESPYDTLWRDLYRTLAATCTVPQYKELVRLSYEFLEFVPLSQNSALF